MGKFEGHVGIDGVVLGIAVHSENSLLRNTFLQKSS
jgi:hypothetical protein